MLLSSDERTIVFLLVLRTDGVTPAADDVVPFVLIRPNGGQFAPAENTPALVGAGWWEYTFSDAELATPGPLIVRASGTGTHEWRDIHQVAKAATPGGGQVLEMAGRADGAASARAGLAIETIQLGPELIANPTFADDEHWDASGPMAVAWGDGVTVTALDAPGYRQLVQDGIAVQPGLHRIAVDFDGNPFQMHLISRDGRILIPTFMVGHGAVEKMIPAGYGDVRLRMVFNSWKPGQSAVIRRVSLRRVVGTI